MSAALVARPLPDEAVGIAPCTLLERGRVAYVFYDRLRAIASSPGEGEVDILGIIIAHEVGHLLLPYGSHSETGVMRGHWDAEELRRVESRRFGFALMQGEQIRRSVSLASLRAQEAR